MPTETHLYPVGTTDDHILLETKLSERDISTIVKLIRRHHDILADWKAEERDWKDEFERLRLEGVELRGKLSLNSVALKEVPRLQRRIDGMKAERLEERAADLQIMHGLRLLVLEGERIEGHPTVGLKYAFTMPRKITDEENLSIEAALRWLEEQDAPT